jgi:hypothetical protein
MARSSLNHAPRSMSRQRSLQNGRNGESADHSTERSHVGHFTIGAAIDQVQQVSTKETSSSACTGRWRTSGQVRNRKLQR